MLLREIVECVVVASGRSLYAERAGLLHGQQELLVEHVVCRVGREVQAVEAGVGPVRVKWLGWMLENFCDYTYGIDCAVVRVFCTVARIHCMLARVYCIQVSVSLLHTNKSTLVRFF